MLDIVNVVRNNIMLIQKKLISIYDYELDYLAEPFYFRLEIHKISDLFIGILLRLDRYRVPPTFPTDQDKTLDLLMNYVLLFVKDEFIYCRDLSENSENEVISIFLEKICKTFGLTSID